ncbi:TolC family protein [Tautonia plasticadhaerens]|uniref:Outer membrane efflux protein n=1 Tax=Tautonia plasticadhaerens TaxID=2527974 RepID=A0A518H738_9BACT|nr:TolC family protein [Tautonia plasticadhaerens]QDV36591.1 Outer membrane efflux protein [Tautonia plasticadhaerens]
MLDRPGRRARRRRLDLIAGAMLLAFGPVPVDDRASGREGDGACPLPAASATDVPPPILPDRLGLAAELPPPPSMESVPASDPGTPLVPGQSILPIDLPAALRLAGARDLDIAIARQRVAEALGELQLARSFWLPSLFFGPNWIRHDGTAQVVEGPVRQISKSSLFMGGTLALGNGVTGPIPAGGPAPLGSLTSVLRLSDAIFYPLAARQEVEANRAAVTSATNDALLGLSEAYFDLQLAAGRLAIAREAAGHAGTLAEVTGSFARTGAGLEADHRRSLAERDLRRREVAEAVGDLEMASAEVVRRTRLDPRVIVAPVEPPEAIVRLVPEGGPPDDLIITALLNRPELASRRAVVEATLVRLKQARLRPFIPSVALRYSAGGFGGGTNAFFGDFDGRQDADVNLFWELQGLGVADLAYAKIAGARSEAAKLEVFKLQDRVASEVVRADKMRLAASRQIEQSERAVPDAIASLDLNFINIRRGAGLPGATRPIEVLQPIQALATARQAYLDSVIAYNRSQFRLYHALGRPASLPPSTIGRTPPAGPIHVVEPASR